MNEDQALYFIKDHKDVYHAYTEVEFHRAIMEQSQKSDRSWCAPVTEIAEVVDKFNQIFKDDICRAVLGCYSRLFYEDMRWNDAIEAAIWKCFVLLSPNSEENQKARENYINEYIPFKIGQAKVGFFISAGDKLTLYHKFIDEQKSELLKLHSVKEFVKWGSALEDNFEQCTLWMTTSLPKKHIKKPNY